MVGQCPHHVLIRMKLQTLTNAEPLAYRTATNCLETHEVQQWLKNQAGWALYDPECWSAIKPKWTRCYLKTPHFNYRQVNQSLWVGSKQVKKIHTESSREQQKCINHSHRFLPKDDIGGRKAGPPIWLIYDNAITIMAEGLWRSNCQSHVALQTSSCSEVFMARITIIQRTPRTVAGRHVLSRATHSMVAIKRPVSDTLIL